MENHWIHPEVVTTKFACDLSRCKGACCTFAGGSGATVDADEILVLQEILPVVTRYLPPEHRALIARDGLFVERDGVVTLRCVNDRACVLVLYDGAIAKCSIQYASERGTTSWIKPRSCHLFPIRVHRGVTRQLAFEEFVECRPALERGERENIPLIGFLEVPLRLEFGDQWYEELCQTISGRSETTTAEVPVC